MKTWKMHLPVKLYDNELLVVASNLSAALIKKDKIDFRRKSVASAFKKRFDGADARVHELNATLSTGYESREVDVEEERDVFAKKIRIRRADTKEIVSERDMAPPELQQEIFDAGTAATVIPIGSGKVAGDTAAAPEQLELTEEQKLAETPEEAEQLRQIRLEAEEAERAAGGGQSPPEGTESEAEPDPEEEMSF